MVSVVPKIVAPRLLQHFRPISVCTTFQKVLAKSLLMRVSEDLKAQRRGQLAGAKGQQCLDIAMMLKMLVEKSTEWAYPALIAKLDINEAYDSISWPGLHRMLVRRGIPDDIALAFRRLISNTTMLVRCGDEHASVIPRRGVKQGSPESTSVFAAAVDECLGIALHDLQELQLGELVLPWHALAWVDDVFLLAGGWEELRAKLLCLSRTLAEPDLHISWASVQYWPLAPSSPTMLVSFNYLSGMVTIRCL